MLVPTGTAPATASATASGLAIPDLPGPADLVPDVVTDFVGDQLVGSVTALLTTVTSDFLQGLTRPVGRFVLSTPDVLAEPTLVRVWGISLACLALLASVAVGISGIALMTGRLTRAGQSAREAVGVRLPMALLTAAVSLPLVALEVGLANALCRALLSVDQTGELAKGNLPGLTASATAAAGSVDGAAGAGAGIAVLISLAVGVVLLVALVVMALARWATLWLLIVLAPLVAAFGLLPDGSGLLRAWWRLQMATVFLPVANAALLATYVAMFRSEQTGLLGALSGVAVLALLTKLPGWAAGAALGVQHTEVSSQVRRGTSLGQRVVSVAAARHPAAGAGRGPTTQRATPATGQPSMARHSMSPSVGPPAARSRPT